MADIDKSTYATKNIKCFFFFFRKNEKIDVITSDANTKKKSFEQNNRYK